MSATEPVAFGATSTHALSNWSVSALPRTHVLDVAFVWLASAWKFAFAHNTYFPGSAARTVATRCSGPKLSVTGPAFVSKYALLGPVGPGSPFGPRSPFGPGGPCAPVAPFAPLPPVLSWP